MLTKNEKLELISLLTIKLQRKARNNLLSFVQYVMPDYVANWHHKKVCSKLEKFANGEIKRLMIFMPPRHGKSELVSRRLPAYLLGRNPRLSIIATSYSADLASFMNRDVQRIIDSDLYREIFPNTFLGGKNIRSVAQDSHLRNSDIFETVGYRGSYRSAGVGGGITGMGGDFIIIDDPIKNQEEANSKVYRDRLWDWYTSTLYTRLEKNAAILLTVTRWHEDDLAGRLLEKERNDPDADKWEVVTYPAILETENEDDPRKVGEALWPFKYDLDRLLGIKSSVGSSVFSSLYQQNPTNETGNLIKKEWWRFYEVRPTRFELVIISWDCTFKDNSDSDYVVAQVWGKIGADYYLLDMYRDKADFVKTAKAVEEYALKYLRARPILIEDKANGPAIISYLKSKISGIVPYSPKDSKEARVFAITPVLEAGNVHIPSKDGIYSEFIDECSAFPKGGHDDMVDSMTQALIYLEGFGKNAFFSDLFKLFGSPEEFLSSPYSKQTKQNLYGAVFFDKETSYGAFVALDQEGEVVAVVSLDGSDSKACAVSIKAILKELNPPNVALQFNKVGYSENIYNSFSGEIYSMDLLKHTPADIDQQFVLLKEKVSEIKIAPVDVLYDHMSYLRTVNNPNGTVTYEALNGLICPTVFALAMAYKCYSDNKMNSMIINVIEGFNISRRVHHHGGFVDND